jgi:hypothetical protein
MDESAVEKAKLLPAMLLRFCDLFRLDARRSCATAAMAARDGATRFEAEEVDRERIVDAASSSSTTDEER